MISNNRKEFIARALDSNAFDTAASIAGGIQLNPSVWDKEVLMAAESSVVAANLGKVYDYTKSTGGDYTVTIRSASAASTAVVEVTTSPTKAMGFSQVTFTPSEFTSTIIASRKEMNNRAFFDIMTQVSHDLGYGYGLAMEQKVLDILIAGVGETYYAGGVANRAAVISGEETLTLSDFTQMRQSMNLAKMRGYAVLLDAYGLKQIDDLLSARATDLGDSSVLTGYQGKLFGFEVYLCDELDDKGAADTVSRALFLGQTKYQMKPFGIAVKENPVIEMERHARERYTDFVSIGEFDVKVLFSAGIRVVEFFSAVDIA